MECPYCRQELVPGVVQSGHRVWFAEQPRNLLLYQGFRKGDLRLIDDFVFGKHPWRAAQHCTRCNKIIIDV